MSEFVQECRREWRRLGVPERDANEMATDLEADLAEAAKDGVAAEEVLGESTFDPHAFATSWAQERGLIPKRRSVLEPQRRLVALAVVVLAAAGLTVGLLFTFRHSSPSQAVGLTATAQQPATTIAAAIAVPDLRRLQQEQAVTVAQSAGLLVHIVLVRTTRATNSAPAGTVIAQNPSPGTSVARGSTITLNVSTPPKH
jgi:hypothetical protein